VYGTPVLHNAGLPLKKKDFSQKLDTTDYKRIRLAIGNINLKRKKNMLCSRAVIVLNSSKMYFHNSILLYELHDSLLSNERV
jgi:hypothetical protein